MTEEHKRKIGEANKGNKNCLGKKNALGYKHTEKWKKQNSIRHKGKLVSEVAKKKMSDYWKKYPNKNMLGKKHSIETRQKMSAAKKVKIIHNGKEAPHQREIKFIIVLGGDYGDCRFLKEIILLVSCAQGLVVI